MPLAYDEWPATSQPSGRRAVLILHGIGYYGEPYRVLADAVTGYGFDVYALDARGHGRSGGKRGTIATPAQSTQDIDAMLAFIQARQGPAKVFLVGESMGGAFAIHYASEARSRISGLVLLAPALGVRKRQYFKLSSFRAVAAFFCRNRPLISLVDSRLENSSRDPNFIRSRRNDPLALASVSYNYLRGIQKTTQGWKTRLAPAIRVPVLILHGLRDPLIDPKRSQEFKQALGSPDKQLLMYADVPHTLLWDPKETPTVLDDIRAWLLKH